MNKDAPERNLVPSLREVVEREGLNPGELSVPFAEDQPEYPELADRHNVIVEDGQKAAIWEVPALRELFRGTRQPPGAAEMDHYPDDYLPYFYFIESHFLTLCAGMGDRTDQEMEEIYSMLRRRPDGKSVGRAHDYMWQAAALLLGIYPLSEQEFDAIFGQMARSARHWALRPISRNYVDYLRNALGGQRWAA